jgi:hypothetical protein
LSPGNSSLERLGKKKDDALSMTEDIEELDDNLRYHKKWKRPMYKKLKAKNTANRRSLQCQVEEMMNQAPEKELVSFLDQVGSFNKKQKTQGTVIQYMTPASPSGSKLPLPDSLEDDRGGVEEVYLRQPSQLTVDVTQNTDTTQNITNVTPPKTTHMKRRSSWQQIQLVHLKGHFFGLSSNPVARGTGFLQFGLMIRHF